MAPAVFFFVVVEGDIDNDKVGIKRTLHFAVLEFGLKANIMSFENWLSSFLIMTCLLSVNSGHNLNIYCTLCKLKFGNGH